MNIKEIVNTNIVWIGISVICLLYKKIYENILYFTNPILQLGDFFMILYQYVVFQTFIFCVLKITGNVFKNIFNIKIDIKGKGFYGIIITLIFLYVLFVVFIEVDILKFTLILSPIRFLVYIFFAILGFLVGARCKI